MATHERAFRPGRMATHVGNQPLPADVQSTMIPTSSLPKFSRRSLAIVALAFVPAGAVAAAAVGDDASVDSPVEIEIETNPDTEVSSVASVPGSVVEPVTEPAMEPVDQPLVIPDDVSNFDWEDCPACGMG